MARLKSREHFIPNGFKFFQPETNWQAPRMASFQTIVSALLAHRRGNPAMASKHGWTLDPEAVADEVDVYNATICERMGWSDYIQAAAGGAAPPPFLNQPSAADQKSLAAAAVKVKKIWSGVRTLNDWIESGEPPVPSELSARRAALCAACPKNGTGDFTKWFTAPAATVIKKQVERLNDRHLSTPSDPLIEVCEVCLCPLKLKVHTPLNFINQHMSEGVLQDLTQVAGCWIVAERGQ